MLSQKLAKELNDQINREFQAAYLYLGLAIYCESRNMDGFANFFRVQAQEEVFHGTKILKYLQDRSAEVKLLALPEPVTNCKSYSDVFSRAVENEEKVSEDLNRIAGLALEERDQITYSFLDWFLKEQIEEMAMTTSVLEKVKLVGEDGNGLYLLNEELKKRTFSVEEAEGGGQ